MQVPRKQVLHRSKTFSTIINIPMLGMREVQESRYERRHYLYKSTRVGWISCSMLQDILINKIRDSK
jgi:hypothetical protein